jgi:hypothetical protein
MSDHDISFKEIASLTWIVRSMANEIGRAGKNSRVLANWVDESRQFAEGIETRLVQFPRAGGDPREARIRELEADVAARYKEVREIMDKLVMLCVGDRVVDGKVCYRSPSAEDWRPISDEAVYSFAVRAIPLIQRLPWTATDHQDPFGRLAALSAGAPREDAEP